jgi:ketosteroid isomerase-like protein
MEFWTAVAEVVDDPYPDPQDFLRVEDRVVVFLIWRGRARRTGEEMALRIIHSLRITGDGGALPDQKIRSLEVFLDTAAFLRATGQEAPE